MKLIAARDFRNTAKLKLPGIQNEHHIHKGLEFELDHQDAKLAELISQLGAAGCIVDFENQPAAYKQIKAEVEAADKKAALAAKK